MRPQSIDESFNQSYQTKGIQPSGIIPEPANDNDTLPDDTYLEAANDNYTTPITPVALPRENQITKQYIRSSSDSLVSELMDSKAVKLAARSKIVATNAGIYSWAFPAWFFIQLPIAILALIFIGLSAVADGLTGDGSSVTVAGFTLSILSGALSGTLNIIDTVTGTNLSELADPKSYAIAFTGIVFLLSLLKLLVIGIIYQVTFVHSVFGRGAAVKISVLIIAICGYFFPVLNLFPWFFAWTFVVALYPR